MEPVTRLDRRFSADDATPTPWAEAREQLEHAETYWLSTVRKDGRPHVTPLLAVWRDGAMYFCTGADEQKGRNLASNLNCALTTGAGSLHEGLDLVVEGLARRVTDPAALKELAAAWEAKYGATWHFEVGDGVFVNVAGGAAQVYELRPSKALGFRKGRYGQTTWRF
ncbi:Nitroimidazol reductase NimA, pyridoxamine 5'-phosphate oxidase superfamily [Nonomuraea maritima]|uniref:Nitroimidazol reductase NimA, pyridoxamine 5'-phosphate oxidase superfamily n=1 Tax=Nonomuraea maritima TaxID=683260 RepID=A0A1G9ARX2_9ACTN|nr:pyridoxamine 5'-phosphate oxidase family protein [Nonomuraea maritima]SDK30066.1 Nitroimidazol reductase NimA, pyridoxamine 5'-phosphate oxidase superfamily [Nonomuraea maritima]